MSTGQDRHGGVQEDDDASRKSNGSGEYNKEQEEDLSIYWGDDVENEDARKNEFSDNSLPNVLEEVCRVQAKIKRQEEQDEERRKARKNRGGDGAGNSNQKQQQQSRRKDGLDKKKSDKKNRETATSRAQRGTCSGKQDPYNEKIHSRRPFIHGKEKIHSRPRTYGLAENEFSDRSINDVLVKTSLAYRTNLDHTVSGDDYQEEEEEEEETSGWYEEEESEYHSENQIINDNGDVYDDDVYDDDDDDVNQPASMEMAAVTTTTTTTASPEQRRRRRRQRRAGRRQRMSSSVTTASTVSSTHSTLLGELDQERASFVATDATVVDTGTFGNTFLLRRKQKGRSKSKRKKWLYGGLVAVMMVIVFATAFVVGKRRQREKSPDGQTNVNNNNNGTSILGGSDNVLGSLSSAVTNGLVVKPPADVCDKVDLANWPPGTKMPNPLIQCQCEGFVPILSLEIFEQYHKLKLRFKRALNVRNLWRSARSCEPPDSALLWLAWKYIIMLNNNDDDNNNNHQQSLPETTNRRAPTTTKRMINQFVLVQQYITWEGKNWKESTNWLEDPDECTWHGVTCDAERGNDVETISLRENGLAGPIQSSSVSPFVFLSKLRVLDVRGNSISGGTAGIPTIPQLQVLDLSRNDLNTSIPTEMASMTSLQTLHLGYNNLWGTVPPEIFDIMTLTELDISHNPNLGGDLRLLPLNNNSLSSSTRRQLVTLEAPNTGINGTFPISTLLQLSSLRSIDLSSTQVKGTLPSEIGLLSLLETLHLEFTKLTGTMPSNIGNMTSLKSLDMSSHIMTGTIPTFIGHLTSVTSINFGAGRFTGPIPSEVGLLTKLNEISFFENRLTGSIPSELGELMSLHQLNIEGNYRLTGSVPSEICKLFGFDGKHSSPSSGFLLNRDCATPCDCCPSTCRP